MNSNTTRVVAGIVVVVVAVVLLVVLKDDGKSASDKATRQRPDHAATREAEQARSRRS